MGIVEFDVVGMPDDKLRALRELPGVSSVSVSDHDLAQFVTIHCVRPADVMTQLGVILEGIDLQRLSSRDPTLEDAYVQLVGDES